MFWGVTKRSFKHPWSETRISRMCFRSSLNIRSVDTRPSCTRLRTRITLIHQVVLDWRDPHILIHTAPRTIISILQSSELVFNQLVIILLGCLLILNGVVALILQLSEQLLIILIQLIYCIEPRYLIIWVELVTSEYYLLIPIYHIPLIIYQISFLIDSAALLVNQMSFWIPQNYYISFIVSIKHSSYRSCVEVECFSHLFMLSHRLWISWNQHRWHVTSWSFFRSIRLE